MLAERPNTVAEVDLATHGTNGQSHDLGRAPPAQRNRAAGGALGEGAQREPPQRRFRAVQCVGPDRRRTRAGAGGLERLQHHALQEVRVLDQLCLRLGDVPLGCGAQLVERRQHLSTHPVAGEVQVKVRFVVGERQARLDREAARLPTLELEQRPHHAAALCREAAERPRSR